MVLIAGVDEAGRGCVIGPLVIAAVGVEEKSVQRLVEAGVKDSKRLSPRSRVQIASSIRRIARVVETRRVSASRIDGLRARGVSMNEIEAMLVGSILSKHRRGVFYVDSVDRNYERFRMMILRHAPGFKGVLIVRNYLDESNPMVGAASIIAKVERDRAVKSLLRKAGLPECSGYSSDPRTVRIVEQLLQSGSKTSMLRRSWSTVGRIGARLSQNSLKRFL
ncbi:MAG: ribonuclease HII [Thermoproteota archaeon]|nr:ribonuclease HII [Candidatus Brockarchaeota archaeon]